MSLLYRLPPDLFRWIVANYFCKKLHTLLVCLFVDKRFNRLTKETALYKQWYGLHCFITPTPIETAVAADELVVVQWLGRKDLSDNNASHLMSLAGRHGTLRSLYMNDHIPQYTTEVILGAAEGNHVDILEWFRGQKKIALEPTYLSSTLSVVHILTVLGAAADRDAVDVFQWSKVHFPEAIERWLGIGEYPRGPQLLRYLWREERRPIDELVRPILKTKDLALNRELLIDAEKGGYLQDLPEYVFEGDDTMADLIFTQDSPELLVLYQSYYNGTDVISLTIPPRAEILSQEYKLINIFRHLGYIPNTFIERTHLLMEAIKRKDLDYLDWLDAYIDANTHRPPMHILCSALDSKFYDGVKWLANKWSVIADALPGILLQSPSTPDLTRELVLFIQEKNPDTGKICYYPSLLRRCTKSLFLDESS